MREPLTTPRDLANLNLPPTAPSPPPAPPGIPVIEHQRVGADQLLYEIDRSKGQILSRYAGKTAERNLRRPAYFSSEAALINDGARWKALPSFALRDSLKVLPPID